ncbi:uncharacterized protein LOC117122410 [Anneissia japonica]|uniref:uncharacterized protein LOC117122410 n=1 Tax=Anneissia japonica TaxID=1529436 RepID=UPI0014259FEC|nr:uncharacterized protein LOC117122410 [Anneissia japonica]
MDWCGYPCSRNGLLKVIEIVFMLVAFGCVMNVVVDILENSTLCNIKKDSGIKCVPEEYSVFVSLIFIVAINILLLWIFRTLSDSHWLIRFELVCCFLEVSFVIIAVVVLTSRIVQYSMIVLREIIGVIVAFGSFPLFLVDAHFAYKNISNH